MVRIYITEVVVPHGSTPYGWLVGCFFRTAHGAIKQTYGHVPGIMLVYIQSGSAPPRIMCGINSIAIARLHSRIKSYSPALAHTRTHLLAGRGVESSVAVRTARDPLHFRRALSTRKGRTLGGRNTQQSSKLQEH